MKPVLLPSQDLLQACLSYDDTTGKLWWKKRHSDTFNGTKQRSATHQANAFNARFAGKEAFTSVSRNGYLRGSINSKTFYAHRVILKLVHGAEPEDVDHINGIRTDNRLSNLRSVSRTDNMRNRCLSQNNTSGYMGVSFSQRHNLWCASIYRDNQPVHLGWFKTKEEAVLARLSAEQQEGYAPLHGRPFQEPGGPSL